MPYIFKGHLRAYLCDRCMEPLRRVTVRLYAAGQQRPTAASPTHGEAEPELLSDREVDARGAVLLGEAQTDGEGAFTVRIDDGRRYDGGEIEVHVRVERIEPGQKNEPVQFVAAVVRPEWQKGRAGQVYDWRHIVAALLWCRIRRWFDAWVICGRLLTCREKVPVAGATVHAYDADWLQDDALGTAVTDGSGHFTIHYTSAQFRKTPLSPAINVEHTEGPDLYFKANLGPTVLVNETQAQGRKRARENVGHCFCVELCTENAKILTCALTGPTGCVTGHADLLPDHVLEIVTGTAAGTIFSHYTLEVIYEGSPLGGAVIYPDAGGNPDPAATQGGTQVVNGKLGYLDLQKLAEGAGAGLATSTTFTVRVHVFGTGGEEQVCTITFSVIAAQVYIRSVGGAANTDWIPENEPLRLGAAVASVGGGVTVRGAADVYGCKGEKISRYRIWARADPTFALPQPAAGSVFASAGWTQVTSVDFTSDDQRINNRLDGSPDPSILTRGAWGTRLVCSLFGWPPIIICNTVPNLPATSWGTPASGKYSVLLEVEDTSGHTYFDIQRVWVDNEDIQVVLSGVGGLLPCMDLYTRETAAPNAFRTVEVEGTAWDELIVAGDTSVPSNNFNKYVLEFQKQGAAGWAVLADSATSVPAAGTPVGVGVLANWDLGAVDRTTNPLGLPNDQLLDANEACTYLLRLRAWDHTLVSESTTHHGEDFFPVKIINAPQP
jgi:hypothetical protein